VTESIPRSRGDRVVETLAREPGVKAQDVGRHAAPQIADRPFPALRRLEQQGWIEGEWGPSENNRRARYYTLTRTGRAQLAEEKRNWYRMTSAMNWMLESEG